MALKVASYRKDLVMKKILLIFSFLFGILFCLAGQYFLGYSYHSFPHFPQKHKFEAILTPEKQFERQKAMGKFPTISPPKTLILCYDDAFLKSILQKYPNKKFEEFYFLSGEFAEFNFLTDYPSIAIARFGWSAPLNAMKLDRAIAWGVKQVIAIGTSCGLQKDLSGDDIIVCEKAIRDEGTSHHYLAYSKYAYPSQRLKERLLQTLKEMNKPYRVGTSWTTDGFYRTTKEEVEHYQKEGVLCVEMEAAALLSVAQYRNIDMVAIFTITDSYANLKWEKFSAYVDKKIKTLNNIFEIVLKFGLESN